jgi:hypothetical protein
MTESGGDAGTSMRRMATLGNWLKQGARGAFLLRPDWRGLRGTPGRLLLAVVAVLALDIGFQRACIVGDAAIYWPALASMLASWAIVAWACWYAMPPAGDYRDARRHPPDAPTLFTMFCVQTFVLAAMLSCALVPALRSGLFAQPANAWMNWPLTIATSGWTLVAALRLMAGCRDSARLKRVLAIALLVASFAVPYCLFPAQFWYPTTPIPAHDTRLRLTQETMELQPRLLASALDAIEPQRPGVIDVYAITFAPYGSEDVFMRESALVAGVMAQRFDASGRTIQLVNNKATVAQLPWATPLNLQRAIARIGQRMDKYEDILFIHLTSHGGADGQLAASLRPMTVDSVTPQALRRWLDDAGIRHRVISISACFSGSWIAPLAGDGTLVMTAADADHTSYGCGSRSDLTFFGRAMYDEQLRHTWSFEQAHAAARKIIDQREREAGKEDGYSNPQIRVGAGIRKTLARLEAQLAASAPH